MKKWRSIAIFGHFANATVRQNGYIMVDFGNEGSRLRPLVELLLFFIRYVVVTTGAKSMAFTHAHWWKYQTVHFVSFHFVHVFLCLFYVLFFWIQSKYIYLITQVILAFWLVLAYDLLEDRRIDDDSVRFNFRILNLNQSHFFAKHSN